MTRHSETPKHNSQPPRPLSRDLVFHFAFAVVAIALNIGSQFAIISVLPKSELTVLFSIFVGTGTGLVGKYLMDKFLIYGSEIKAATSEAKDFGIYTLTGAFTTLIFWVIEYGFHLIFQSDGWRYFGGVIGLIIGYTIKFFVDRRLVFSS